MVAKRTTYFASLSCDHQWINLVWLTARQSNRWYNIKFSPQCGIFQLAFCWDFEIQAIASSELQHPSFVWESVPSVRPPKLWVFLLEELWVFLSSVPSPRSPSTMSSSRLRPCIWGCLDTEPTTQKKKNRNIVNNQKWQINLKTNKTKNNLKRVRLLTWK